VRPRSDLPAMARRAPLASVVAAVLALVLVFSLGPAGVAASHHSEYSDVVSEHTRVGLLRAVAWGLLRTKQWPSNAQRTNPDTYQYPQGGCSYRRT
jgi:protein-S-isoprenylcysteine O-methyltransferase Ste14